MAREVIMPKLGMVMSEGRLVRWLKSEGESVQEGEAIAEIETDKATAEIEAPATGILGGICVQPGESVPVGTVLAFILEPGEEPPSSSGDESAGSTVGPGSAGAQQSQVLSVAESYETAAAAVASTAEQKEPRLTPAARRVARELGLDLEEIAAAFPGRRVGRDELLAWASSRSRRDSDSPASGEIPGHGTGEEIAASNKSAKGSEVRGAVRRPVTSMRATIARRMTESLRESAQLTLSTQVNVDALVRFRSEMAAIFEAEYGVRLTYTDFIVKAVARAVKAVPSVNARWEGDAITIFPWVHVGVAVALDDGLVVPVIRHAEAASIFEISRRLQDLRERARAGRLTLDEMTGSTITISNLGMEGIDVFTPILNPPEVAILGVGRIRQVAHWVDGEWRPVHAMTLSLTIDHRVVDGVPGARFLARVAELLARPAVLVASGDDQG